MSNDGRNTHLITQILSAGAVVLSLVFVGLEVRESARQTALNTQSLQAAAYQELVGRIMEMNVMAMTEADAVPVYLQDQPLNTLSSDERRQLRSLHTYRLRYGDLAFYQYELGMLSQDRFESAMRPLTDNVCNELFGQVWSSMKPNFVVGYGEYIESELSRC